MNNKEEIQQEIVKKAVSYAEANVYSLNNPYLNPLEKQEVELWFQLPGNVMFYSFVVVVIWSIFKPLSWITIIGIPLLTNIVIGILNWYFYNKKLIYNLYLTVLHSWTLHLVGLGVAIFLFFKGEIILGIISLIAPFGILAFVEPHLFFYNFLANKYKMHPKWAFFKKEYNRKFPFEDDLE